MESAEEFFVVESVQALCLLFQIVGRKWDPLGRSVNSQMNVRQEGVGLNLRNRLFQRIGRDNGHRQAWDLSFQPTICGASERAFETVEAVSRPVLMAGLDFRSIPVGGHRPKVSNRRRSCKLNQPAVGHGLMDSGKERHFAVRRRALEKRDQRLPLNWTLQAKIGAGFPHP